MTKPMRRLIATLAFGLFAATAPAQTIEEIVEQADALIGEGRYDSAIELLTPFAASGDGGIEFELAFAHMNRAIGKNPAKPDAQDLAEAVAWVERAIEHGSAMAQNLLSIMYRDGLGVPVDDAKAIELMQRSAEAGDDGAKANWGIRAYYGEGIERDRRKACELLSPFVDRIPYAGWLVGAMTYIGECGAAPDPARGIELIRAAAELDEPGAAHDMGRFYENGAVGIEADLVEALAWYEIAAKLGEPDAQWRVGLAHAEGEFRERNPELAVKLFERAVEGGSVNGHVSLAVMYATGDGVDLDYAKARELYERAAERGSAQALKNLAVMYLNGEGVAVDRVRARVLAEQAVELGSTDAPALRDQIDGVLTRAERAEVERELDRRASADEDGLAR